MDIPTPTECFNKKHCLAFVILNWLFTPIATQGYLPTMPLLVTEVMGLETTTLGYLYSTKMACNLVGCFALVPLLRNFSARKATIAFLVLRAVSGTGGRASNGADCCQLAAAAGADGVNLGSGLGPAEDFSLGKRSGAPKQPRDDLDDDDGIPSAAFMSSIRGKFPPSASARANGFTTLSLCPPPPPPSNIARRACCCFTLSARSVSVSLKLFVAPIKRPFNVSTMVPA